MLHEVVAKEEDGWAKVLLYGPGIIATDIQRVVRESDNQSEMSKFLVDVCYTRNAATPGLLFLHLIKNITHYSLCSRREREDSPFNFRKK
jgi:hypothetical protein